MIMSKQEGLPKTTFGSGNCTFLLEEDTGHLKTPGRAIDRNHLSSRDEVGETSSEFFRTQSGAYHCDQICQEDACQNGRKPSEESALAARSLDSERRGLSSKGGEFPKQNWLEHSPTNSKCEYSPRR